MRIVPLHEGIISFVFSGAAEEQITAIVCGTLTSRFRWWLVRLS